jgi:DeoR family transcriptional regulator, suf operon transcriptional repressor
VIPIGGDTQRQILALLLGRKEGMTVDQMADHFGIGRTAINQHLATLKQQGHVANGQVQKGRGRPRKSYVLTNDGINLFPKKYSWFSALLLNVLQGQMGADQLADFMRNLGTQMAQDQLVRVDGKRAPDKVAEIVKIMNEAGFDARVIVSQGDEVIPRIECKNCVYHDLARDYSQVCQFDLGFLSGLMGQSIEHQTCMVRGGTACRFRFPAMMPGANGSTAASKKPTKRRNGRK